MDAHTHIHKESGNLYRLLFLTNTASDRDSFPVTAIYIDGFGELWSRPMREFKEKFEEVDCG